MEIERLRPALLRLWGQPMANGGPVRGFSRPCRVYWRAGVASSSCLAAASLPGISGFACCIVPVSHLLAVGDCRASTWANVVAGDHVLCCRYLHRPACQQHRMSHRMDTCSRGVGVDENFFNRSLAIGAATQCCWRRGLGRRPCPVLCLVVKQTGPLARYPPPPCRQGASAASSRYKPRPHADAKDYHISCISSVVHTSSISVREGERPRGWPQ
jgi:hypothetical protein